MSGTTIRVLVVDDEPDLCEILAFNLESEGFVVSCAYSAEAALALIEGGESLQLILLDVMLEKMSGFEMARTLRQRGDDTPIIFLTARDAENDLLEGFGAGGDDYVTKPFSFPTVLARVRAVLKRAGQASKGNEAGRLSVGGIDVDLERQKVTVDGMNIPLTKKEYRILTLLIQNSGSHFTRQQILDSVWDDDTFVNERSVDVHIARLRKKLGKAGNGIVNHSGFGYIFQT